MGASLEKALITFSAMETGGEAKGFIPDARCSLIITILYLVAMLSIPLGQLSHLIWFAAYPILGAAIQGISFSKLFTRSLLVLPFIALIGVANPFFNREPALTVEGITVSKGWIEFIAILLRGLFSVQVLLLLCASSGLYGMCRAMNRLGVPDFLTSVLLMICRYITVLLEEALSMRRARASRGYGKKYYSISEWGTFIGQLMVRTLSRGERVYRAMNSRGFDGKARVFGISECWKTGDMVYLLVWIAVFVALWFVNPSRFFMV